MKKLTILSVAILVFAMAQPQIGQAGDATKIDHYASKEFASKQDAFAGLVSTSAEMATIAADPKLDTTKMEKIHQISYTTENAVAKLGAGEKLAAALEEVHLASEEHDPTDLKNKFITYQSELNRYLAKQ